MNGTTVAKNQSRTFAPPATTFVGHFHKADKHPRHLPFQRLSSLVHLTLTLDQFWYGVDVLVGGVFPRGMIVRGRMSGYHHRQSHDPRTVKRFIDWRSLLHVR